ncbi:hypothetical protein [Escherichia coli]|uniref:hypothetical protein n=1 Tax=Escherichia coli TaxID=562 RepID=UPI00207A560D|nr:hypothetical protein [Escherichia coli]
MITPARTRALSRANPPSPRGLVIIDEADHLRIDGMEQLQAIRDAGVGMVLIGNPKGLFSDPRSDTNDLARLFSRIARVKQLHEAKKEDVLDIAGAWGISGGRRTPCEYRAKNQGHYVF